MLNGWKKLTTRLLEKPGPEAWYILDDPLDNDDDSAAAADGVAAVTDPGLGSSSAQPASVAQRIHHEMECHGVWSRFTPARTTSEAKVDRLLGILGKTNNNDPPNHPSTFSAPPRSDKDRHVRGDSSFFVSRQERRDASFARNLPTLAKLIHALESTVERELPRLALDRQSTSVQVAEYPGDGISGYPRHCDRTQRRDHSSIAHSTEPERVITAVYYLTDEDWDGTFDGGALRLFHNEKFTDVIPYANRMVVFRSDAMEHQVMPSHGRPRRALTIWLYGTVTTGPHMLEPEALQSSRQVSKNPETPSSLPPLPVDPIDSQNNDRTTAAKDTIFVSIAAYRDSETGPTIRQLFGQAKNPKSIFVGLVLQVDLDSDYDCQRVVERLPTKEWWYKDHVRVLQLEARHASGPCPARAMAQLLHRGEQFLLQIDSHMRMRKNWDIYLIQQLTNHCPNPRRSLLSTYPVGYHLSSTAQPQDSESSALFYVKDNEIRGTRLVPWKFDESGFLRQKGVFLSQAAFAEGKPIRTQLFAAGFCFGMAEWLVKDAPYEGLHHLFFGEEQSMAVRLFTRGYDMYAPAESVCYHLWSRAHRPPPPTINSREDPKDGDLDGFQHQQAQLLRHESQAHVRSQLEEGNEFLGLERTVNDWGQSLGVDFVNRTIYNPRDEADGVGAENEEPARVTGSISAHNILDDNIMNRIQAFMQK